MVVSASTRPSQLPAAAGLHPSMLADRLPPRGAGVATARLVAPALPPVAADATVADRARVAQRLLAFGSW